MRQSARHCFELPASDETEPRQAQSEQSQATRFGHGLDFVQESADFASREGGTVDIEVGLIGEHAGEQGRFSSTCCTTVTCNERGLYEAARVMSKRLL